LIIFEYLVLILLSYLLGSLPTGLILSRVLGKGDLRQFGSGKTGATNVLRTVGKGAAIVVVFFDFGKGAIPALVGLYFLNDDILGLVGASSATIGHVFPIFAGFRGGRGVATVMGGLLVLLPWLGVLILGIGAFLLVVFKIASVMSLGAGFCGIIISIILSILGHVEVSTTVYVVLGTMFIFVTHISNLKRLYRGEEPKIGLGGDRKVSN
tara:strand:+ start:4603 stop:5232 length:630 start_codon:yes stop_codon:yes gene_type:complete